jgi:type IV secretion system protein VirB9
VKPFSLLFALSAAAGVCIAADPSEVIRHTSAGPEDIIRLNTADFEYSSVVLPEGEKAVTYLCGDPKHWDVQIIEGAERFVNVKPSPGAHATDVQILTDHNHNYTVKAEVKTPVDIKLFLDSTDVESLRKPPTFVPATEAQRVKTELEQTQAELARLKKQADETVRGSEDQYRATYPHKLTFDYDFKRDEAPFRIHNVWHDDRFTYIAANPDEVASFYELKDGKPNLVQFQFQNGLYVVRDIVDRGYLQVGKKKADITRKPNS